jgi:hypothetical protein
MPPRASKAESRASVFAGVNDPNPPRALNDTRGLNARRSFDALSAGDNASASMEIAPADAPKTLRRLRTNRIP